MMGNIYYSLVLFLQLISLLVLTSSITVSRDTDRIKYYLYPKRNDPNHRVEILQTNNESLKRSGFKMGVLTVFIIHGYNSNSESPAFKIITDAYVNSPFEANYIVVDWGELAGKEYLHPNNMILFPLVLRNIRRVGKHIANFIDWLQYSGDLNLYHVHLIGHSLGTHVAGAVGKVVQNSLGGFKLPRITGLDPSGPVIWPEDTWRNIKRSDGEFVDIIHTNYYEAETRSTEGHVDFIVNHETIQEDCAITSNVITSCNYDWASTLFARSFTAPSTGCQCSELDLGPSNFDLCLNECPNRVWVGLYTPHSARGIYSV